MEQLISAGRAGEEIRLYGRGTTIRKIHDFILNNGRRPENIALLGVRGIGKSAVINDVFSDKQIRSYYTEGRIVAERMTAIPETAASMKDYYSYFYQTVIRGLMRIRSYDSGEFEKISARLKEEKENQMAFIPELDEAAGQALLESAIRIATKEFHLKLLIVIDDFENLAAVSGLKNAQYSFMRHLADNGLVSMFISTAQDLTKVSEEMRGSGFENIFTYIDMDPLDYEEIEWWLDDACAERNMRFSNNIIDWIEDISGGIPALVRDAANLAYEKNLRGEAFSEAEWTDELYEKVQPMMRLWWEYSYDNERKVLRSLAQGVFRESHTADNLIRKSYLKEDISGRADFITPLFQRYVKELPEKAPEGEEKSDFLEARLSEMQSMVTELSSNMNSLKSTIDDRFETLREQIESIPRPEDYLSETGEVDLARYNQDIAQFLSAEPSEEEAKKIQEAWNISEDMWNRISPERLEDCCRAYRLMEQGFSRESENINYSPVTFQLGNFLEGVLNEHIVDALKLFIPEALVMVGSTNIPVREFDPEAGTVLTIGAVKYALFNKRYRFHKEAGQSFYALDNNLNESILLSFRDKIEDCRLIRNKADHHGERTTYQDLQNFVGNMFFTEDSILNVLFRIESLYRQAAGQA